MKIPIPLDTDMGKVGIGNGGSLIGKVVQNKDGFSVGRITVY